MSPSVAMVIPASRGDRHCGIEDYARELAGSMSSDQVGLHKVPLPGFVHRNQLLSLVKARRHVAERAKRLPQVDLVHVHYADVAWNGLRIGEDYYDVFSRRCRGPLALTIHEHAWLRPSFEEPGRRTASDYVFSALGGHGLSQGKETLDILMRHQGIHVHHTWQKQKLLEGGVPEKRISVIPFPVQKRESTVEAVDRFLSRFGLQGKRIIAMVGFVFDRKRHDRVLSLLPKLSKDVVLCLLGGANDPNSEAYCTRLHEQAAAAGVSDRFLITGYLEKEELDAGLVASTVVAAPYSDVTSSASVAMVIGAGVPVVTEQCDTFAEMREQGAGIETVNAEDENALLEALVRLLEDTSARELLREKHRQYAGAHSLSAIAAQLTDWYREMQQKGGR